MEQLGDGQALMRGTSRYIRLHATIAHTQVLVALVVKAMRIGPLKGRHLINPYSTP